MYELIVGRMSAQVDDHSNHQYGDGSPGDTTQPQQTRMVRNMNGCTEGRHAALLLLCCLHMEYQDAVRDVR